SGQAPGGGAAPDNVTVATPPPAAAATPAGAATPATGATTKPAATAAATAAAKPTTQVAAQPSGPQEISVNALQGEPDNLDPNRSSFSTEGAVIRQVFEPLLTFDKDLKPVPAAASGYDVSQDGRTYTFHLKQGAKWSD